MKVLNEKVPKLRQEVKVTVDIVTSDDIKIYYTGKFKGFTARYIINLLKVSTQLNKSTRRKLIGLDTF